MEIQRLAGEPATIVTAGSVVDVLEGRPPGQRWIDVSTTAAGFEAGSPKGLSSIGEMVSFNGIAFTRSTAEGAEHGTLLTGDQLLSNGAAFLPADARPTWRAEIGSPLALQEVYAAIYAELGQPFFVVGVLDFEGARVTAITRAPVYGEKIFDHREQYYANGNRDIETVQLAIVGCAARLEEVDDATRDGLGAVLYDNPFAEKSAMMAHTHALELTQRIEHQVEITAELGADVHHLFDDSLVSSGTLDVYVIGGFEPVK